MEASSTATSNEEVHKIEYVIVAGLRPGVPRNMSSKPFIVDQVNKMLNEGWELQGGVSVDDYGAWQAMIKKH
jgi:hypothetical protein